MARKNGSLTQMIDGDYYSSYLDPDKVREALRFTPGRGDIVQMTYPASGTHWMQQMIQLILHGGRSASSYREFESSFTFLEAVGKPAEVASTSSPRHLTTHIRPGKLAISSEAKCVYVARNPWDACASLYELQREIRGLSDRQTFDDFVSLFLQGLAGHGDYFEHVRAGYLRKDEPNVFFVTYEAMAADLEDVVLRLADFLGTEYGQALRQNSESLSEIVTHRPVTVA
ncbi:sulfotransferase 2B1-like [Rhipicephalus sanguineus]|uniref:sulfotransferase 2B1-like n=1 Tax=Rhipicephalus sanguineus TaxID=34632 RepID=UPI0020C5ABC2|nr:sulfotransferase 2B1-like [Rhipicephalus sanguineus]